MKTEKKSLLTIKINEHGTCVVLERQQEGNYKLIQPDQNNSIDHVRSLEGFVPGDVCYFITRNPYEKSPWVATIKEGVVKNIMRPNYFDSNILCYSLTVNDGQDSHIVPVDECFSSIEEAYAEIEKQFKALQKIVMEGLKK